MQLRVAFGLVLATSVLAPVPGVDRKKGRQIEGALAKPISLELPCMATETPCFPFVGDFDGDGREDLLLGAPGGGEKGNLLSEDGRLQIFRNVGTNAKPRLSTPDGFNKWAPNSDIPRG